MNGEVPTRREFLSRSTSAVGGAWLLGMAPLIAAAQACAVDARRRGLPLTILTEREGLDFDAWAARILPTDDTPGAREAGAVYFADQALGSFAADLLPIVRGGLVALNERVVSTFDGAEAFADLSEERQDEIVAATEQEDPGFFFFARALVMTGVVSDPRYGGNRDGVGWRLLGFEAAFRYEPPFGYYDRHEHGEGTASAPSSGASAGPHAASEPTEHAP